MKVYLHLTLTDNIMHGELATVSVKMMMMNEWQPRSAVWLWLSRYELTFLGRPDADVCSGQAIIVNA